MRTKRRLGLAAAALLLGLAGEGRAQQVVSSGGTPVRGYDFNREPLMSVNRSYLGYGNFTYQGASPPAPGYVTPYGQAVNRGGYAYARNYNALRPRRGLFGRLRRN